MTQNPAKMIAPKIPSRHEKARTDSAQGADYYPDDVIALLCERHAIEDPHHMRLLMATLDFASGRYLAVKRQESIQLSPTEIKQHLTALSRSAKKLGKLLEQLPPKTKEVFLSAEGELQGELEGRVYETIHQREASAPSRME